jgi:hypothetical protein
VLQVQPQQGIWEEQVKFFIKNSYYLINYLNSSGRLYEYIKLSLNELNMSGRRKINAKPLGMQTII